jgi:multicomponent Na+:H+ antiporter subunit G
MTSNVIIGYAFITIGAFFDLFGCIGLVRFPDVYNRLQAATKCVTLGTIMILVGTAIVAAEPTISIKAILCAAFIALTSPTGAHALARGAYLSGVGLWEKSVVDQFKGRADEIKAQHGDKK